MSYGRFTFSVFLTSRVEMQSASNNSLLQQEISDLKVELNRFQKIVQNMKKSIDKVWKLIQCLHDSIKFYFNNI